MDEFAKLAAGAGVGTAFAIYYLLKIAPKLEDINLTLIRTQKMELIRLAATPTLAPVLHEAVKELQKEVDAKLVTKTESEG